jgi:hypothetical protein
MGTIPTDYKMQVRAGFVLSLNCTVGVISLPEASLFMWHVFKVETKKSG